MEFLSRAAGRDVEQQHEQLAVLQPEQQQSDEREQQYWVPCRESPENFPDGQTCRGGRKPRQPCQAQGLPAHPACPFNERAGEEAASRPRRVAPRKTWPVQSCGFYGMAVIAKPMPMAR